jgi:predicted ATPase/DNA-binding SARP family transcriptional activator
MQFGILGPLEVLHHGVRLHLGGVRRKAVLARLLLDPGRAVTAERLIDDVWADEPPATARKTLQKYVSELRRELPEPVVRTSGAGYLLDISSEYVDSQRFERLVERGDFAGALGLWRGEVLADLPGFAFVAAERARLDELRLLAWQGRIDRDIEAGRHEQAVGEVAELVEAHPYRERLVRLQMLALYRSGRQGEALEVFQRYRRRATEDLGVEPGQELRDLHVAILRQEPTLDGPRTVARPVLAGGQGNLPPALTSFIGRRRELATVEQRLAANRLVTLTGPGGVGKTRLAVHAAGALEAGFEAGAWLVDLAEVTTSDQVAVALAIALHIDVRHAPDDLTAIEAGLAHGGSRLVVLDNCEHLAGACSELLRRLLRGCPGVTVLATSRRPLGVEGEYVLPLRSLRDADAVQLFVERARLTGQLGDGDWTPEQVAQLCRRLDSLPLAIELAASQLRVLSLPDLAARLSDRLAFRGTGERPSPRQGTLRDMVSWSYDLIPDSSKQVFARLGVFKGSLTLEAAEAVCADLHMTSAEILGHVTTLVDHSLLLRTGHPYLPDSRYRLLESLSLFALERLADSGAVESARRAHASYSRMLAAEAGRHIYGTDERLWQRRLEVEAPNVEAALAWAAADDWSLAVDLAVALWPYWDAGWGERGAVAYLDRLLAVTDPPDREKRAWALVVAADMAANQGDARKAVPWAREAVEAFGPDGDARGRACAMVALGAALGGAGALREAAEVIAEAVVAADRLGDDVLAARALNRQHFVAARHGDQALAADLGRRELDRWLRVGSSRGEATALRHMAVTAFRFGDLDQATALCQRALAIWRDVDDPAAVAHVQTTLGDIARERGDTSRASALYRAALVDLQAVGDRRCEASTCKNLASILVAEDAHEQGARLYREGIALRDELGDEAGLAECLEGLAGSLRALSQHEQSVTLLGAATALRTRTDSVPSASEQEYVERLDAAEQAELGPRRFEESWQRGQRMGVSEVVAFALAEGRTSADRRA